MSISGIQGHLLEVTVIGCNKLKDTQWISRQDPYVCLEYGGTKFRTRTHTDGGKNPVFQEKFTFPLIEGLRELNVVVWNSNTITSDDFIGSGKVQLFKVLSQGFDDSAWPIQTNTGRPAGEVKLILHYANSKGNDHSKKTSSYAPSAPPYAPPATSYPPPPPPAVLCLPVATTYLASSPYPPYSSAYSPPPYPPPPATYPPYSSAYSPPPYPPPPATYPPYSSASSPPPYPPPPPTYPPPPYPPTSAYPPSPYP